VQVYALGFFVNFYEPGEKHEITWYNNYIFLVFNVGKFIG